ncbi:hypothetical protein Acr_07g0012080 [Actinidia rufa]|uniref:Uncharacterized protein n=1 Tax=Actinidia rufa TaxID=165716 RepID=A0A7J0EX76_9ERIC|nr:hypothetical protein Acr_07g0012080 [Actinidia rufa]
MNTQQQRLSSRNVQVHGAALAADATTAAWGNNQRRASNKRYTRQQPGVAVTQQGQLLVLRQNIKRDCST